MHGDVLLLECATEGQPSVAVRQGAVRRFVQALLDNHANLYIPGMLVLLELD